MTTNHDRALRFITAGSVDDGKSTLIGRLLYDSRSILADQLAHLEHRAAGGDVDLSLLTDGLEAEREQGITIDVAWRYFATPRRKFIIADSPGHEQYTRNMVTAAAGSDAAVVLVDVTKVDWKARPVALLPQTRRHTLLARLLGVPTIIFALNKIDALEDPAAAYAAVRDALHAFARDAGVTPAAILPVSALKGWNVAERSDVAGYAGPSLLELLEQAPSATPGDAGAAALPVQYVARHGDGANPMRIFWGRLARGQVRAGDAVKVLPGGGTATVRGVWRAGEAVAAGQAGESIGLELDRPLDVSRGDWLVASAASAASAASGASAVPQARSVRATLAWLDTTAATVGRKYLVRHAQRWIPARVTAIEERLDIHTLEPQEAHELGVNDIGRVTLELQQAVPLAPYADNATLGAMIVVDPATHRTSGAVLVHEALDAG